MTIEFLSRGRDHNPFRKNRRASVDEVTVDGRLVERTKLDRARFDRHQVAVDAAEKALNVARSQQAKPYSIAAEAAHQMERMINSAGRLLGAVGLACAGVALAVYGAIEANTPDAILVERAMELRAAVPPPSLPDGSTTRAVYLYLLGWGIALGIAGIVWLVVWLKAPLREKPVSK